jgi:uncharacterized protein YeaO (DUF488 family)
VKWYYEIMAVEFKRVYEEPSTSDGTRILVDRLWPRGLTKEKAKIDVWLKDIAPTTELRKWFNHEPNKWPEFQKRYWTEISNNTDILSTLKRYLANGKVTIVYGAKDEEHNDAVVIKQYLNKEDS